MQRDIVCGTQDCGHFNVRDKIDFPWITVDGDLKVEGLLIDSTVLLYPAVDLHIVVAPAPRVLVPCCWSVRCLQPAGVEI